MTKSVLIMLSAVLLLSSCGTYTGSGAYAGGAFGSIIGSAIGGIAGGRHGSHVGTLIGMAGGAAVGAAVGAAADQKEQQRYEDYRAARENYRQRRYSQSQDSYSPDYSGNYSSDSNDSGFDASNSGDDRLYGFGEDFSSRVDNLNAEAKLEIRNARLLDASRDGELTRGEEARLVFEIYNISQKTAYNVLPTVKELTGNQHIRISENVLIESILPGKGVRYTASVKADNRLKEGTAVFQVSVLLGNKEVTSQSKQFRVRTSKK